MYVAMQFLLFCNVGLCAESLIVHEVCGYYIYESGTRLDITMLLIIGKCHVKGNSFFDSLKKVKKV